MNNAIRVFGVVLLAVAVAAPLSAQKKKRKNQLPAGLRKALAKVDLSEQQQTKIKELTAEYAPKLAETRLDRQVAKARAAALKQAKQEGKKNKAAQAAADSVLTAEQREKRAKFRELNRALRAAVIAVLTPEQLMQAGLKKPRQRKKPA